MELDDYFGDDVPRLANNGNGSAAQKVMKKNPGLQSGFNSPFQSMSRNLNGSAQTCRSISGLLINNLFGTRFRHLQKLHTDSFGLGFNAICLNAMMPGPRILFRSSLPGTI